MDPHLVISLVL